MATDKPVISLEVKIGKPKATPSTLPEALAGTLRKVSVNHKFQGVSGFSLEFEADRYSSETGADQSEYEVLATDLLDPFCRVHVIVKIVESGVETMLIDGFITQQDLSASESGATISVRGEDVSVKMDLFDVFTEYSMGEEPKEGKKNSEIATAILGKYSSLADSSVSAPTGEPQPKDPRTQQTTDRKYLEMLAQESACLFFVEPPSSASGKSTAYWGPAKPPGSSQTALTINWGPADNTTQVSASHNGLAPTMTYGEYLVTKAGESGETKVEKIAVASVSSSDVSGYYADAPIPGSLSSLAQSPDTFTQKLDELSVRGTLFKIQQNVGDSLDRAKAQAQAVTDNSVESVVTVNGTLDSALYGAVLLVRGSVDLRGVGKRYDGTYLVKSVDHNLSFEAGTWSYTQGFSLVRGGTGTTISEVAKF